MSTRESFNKDILGVAGRDAFRKLNPRTQIKNPVMFIVYIGCFLTTGLMMRDIAQGNTAHIGFSLQIVLWLWFTVLFANFAEATLTVELPANPRAVASPPP